MGGNTSNFDDLPPHEFPPGSTSEKPKRLNGAQKFIEGDAPPLPIGESAFQLVERDMPEPVRLCDPWATEGVNIIAGRPKLGKTTLERQKLAAAAVGGPFLDSHFPEVTKSLFLSLEEGALLTRMKFKMAGFNELALASIQLHFEWPRGPQGVELLDRYLKANPDIRLVCIDSLTKFRAIPDARTPAFTADYEAVSALHEVSKLHPGICIDLIHHTRKAKSEDPIDDISGTFGLTAACDSYVVMRHHADGALIYVGGRLWVREDAEYRIQRAPNHQWVMIGPNSGLTDEQVETLRHVRAEQGGMSGVKLGEALNITRQSAWERLDSLIEKGVALKRMGKVYAK